VWLGGVSRRSEPREKRAMATAAPAVAVTGTAVTGNEKREKRGGNRSTNPHSAPSANFTTTASGIRLSKPNKEDLEKLSNEIQSQISLLQNESKDIKKQIDKLLGARNGSKVT
jgi:predicted phage-related endonuclease